MEMVKQDSKPPRFRAKGAETRHVVPFCADLAVEMWKAVSSPHKKTVADALRYLLGFYMCFGTTPFDPKEAEENCRRFLLLYKSLADEAVRNGLVMWRLKPKFHLMQELGEVQVHEFGDPSLFWAYMDEDFVGYVGKIAYSRGGTRSAQTTPRNVLQKYRIVV